MNKILAPSAVQDVSAERVVLAATLVIPDEIPTVASELTANDFFLPLHGQIFDAILDAYADGQVGAVLVARRMIDTGKLRNSQDSAYLAELVGLAPVAGQASTYAKIVADLAQRREIGIKSERLTNAIREPGINLERIANLVNDVSQATQTRTRDTEAISIGEMIDPGLADIETRKTRNAGIKTGFADLDKLTGGLRPGQLIVIAGRPGMGKSTIALDIARHVAIHSNRVVEFCSYEMSNQELFDRALSAQAQVPLQHIRTGDLTEDDWIRIGRAIGPMSEARLFLRDKTLTIKEIHDRCAGRRKSHGLNLVIVDYLQLIPADKRSSSREQDVAGISRALKALARDLNVPVIAVAQLNRKAADRIDKRPQLNDLRESGAIENDADLVILVHREDYYEPETSRAGEADLIVAKHRNGPTDTVVVAAQLHYARFCSMAVEDSSVTTYRSAA